MLTAAILVVFPLCMAIAGSSDLFTMQIPNRVSAILIAGFVVIAPLAGFTALQIGMHFMAAAVVFAVVFALFALNVMGGGDAKVLAASALWFGWNPSLVSYLVFVAFFGGLLTVMIVLLRSKHDTILLTGLDRYIPGPLFEAKKIPYGIAIATGAFMAYPSSPLMQMLLPA